MVGGSLSAHCVRSQVKESVCVSVGTSFYIAPEIQKRWPSYDSKVDMYSLGIVVFELWHPFSTGMERILTLRDLKEKGQLPSQWKQDHPTIATLVLWLLSSHPANRPSAKELLRSDYLPPRVGDEQLQDLIRSLEDDTETYERVVEGVFRSSQATKRSETSAGVTLSDVASTPSMQYGNQIEVEDNICSTVKEIFSMHGAIRMRSQDVRCSLLRSNDDNLAVDHIRLDYVIPVCHQMLCA